jgi:hypothetical protein
MKSYFDHFFTFWIGWLTFEFVKEWVFCICGGFGVLCVGGIYNFQKLPDTFCI